MVEPAVSVRSLLADLDRVESAVRRVRESLLRERQRARNSQGSADRAARAVSLLREEREAVRVTLARIARDETPDGGEGAS